MLRRAFPIAAVVGVLFVAVAPAQNPASVEARVEYLLRRSDAGTMPTPMLIAMLRDPYPETRILALRVVAASADPSQAELLPEFLRDRDIGVRYQTMVAAGRFGSAGRGVALAGLADGVARVRQAAAWAACHGGDEALAPLVQRMAGEADVGVRATALANLWRFGDAEWEPHAAAASASDQAQLRRAAAYSLARSTRPAARAALRRLATDPEAVIRATAVAGLARAALAGDDMMVVKRALGDPDARVRLAACTVLAAEAEPALDPASAAAAAAAWRQWDQPQLAVTALRAAGARREIGGDDELVAIATGGEPWLAAEALAALARRGAGPASEIAAVWMKGGEPWRRRAVAVVASRLGAGTVRAVLADPEPGVRLAWLESLEPDQVGGQAAVLQKLVDADPDPAVRAAAVDHLAEVGAAGGFEALLARARSWGGDGMPDARAAALVAALAVAGDDEQRQRVLERAAADPDPAVAVVVTNGARELGLPVRSPEREIRHNQSWYLELTDWMKGAHWLDVVTDRGTFRVRLAPLEAPIGSREIFDLAASGFYDGLSFHRVAPNFVVQGGDPRGDGWGGCGFTLPDEPAFRPFDSGRVGIATSGPNTGGSQLFVTLMPADHLTGHYTNIGEVVAGREVLTRLRVGDRIRRVEAVSGDEPPPPAPTLTGELDWQSLAELPGWRTEHDSYRPDPALLERLAAAAGSYRVVTVLGTWCSDSEREVPRLVKILDGATAFRHTMIGVDRTRRVDDPGLALAAGVEGTVERVPTIVVLDADGGELGRVVETAERPLEDLLVEFIAPAEGWQ